jgi:hypothetical protein
MLLDSSALSDIKDRIVALVKFGRPTSTDGLRPGEFYQVVIDPKKFSPCGYFIRLGDYDGDELVGWQMAESLFMVSVLGHWPYENDKPHLEYFESPALESP